jgi:hypothetical protein
MTDEQKIAHVVDMCQRFGRDFSLSEVIRRIMDERPELILEFAEIWGGLVRRKMIRVFSKGAPCTYEVVNAPW